MVKTFPARISGDKNTPLRFIIFHINSNSAKLQFLCAQENSICFPMPLPRLAEIVEPGKSVSRKNQQNLTFHPGAFVKDCCNEWQLPSLHLKGYVLSWVETPRGTIPVYPLQAKMVSPFEPPPDTQWIELPDSFSLPAIEREILKSAYEWLLGAAV